MVFNVHLLRLPVAPEQGMAKGYWGTSPPLDSSVSTAHHEDKSARPTHYIVGVGGGMGDISWRRIALSFAGNKRWSPDCGATTTAGFNGDEVEKKCIPCVPLGTEIGYDLSPALGFEPSHSMLMLETGLVSVATLQAALHSKLDFRALSQVRDPRDVLVASYLHYKQCLDSWTRLESEEAFDRAALAAEVESSLPPDFARNIAATIRASENATYCALLESLSLSDGLVVEAARMTKQWTQLIDALNGANDATQLLVPESHAFVRYEDMWREPHVTLALIGKWFFGADNERAVAFTQIATAADRRARVEMEARLGQIGASKAASAKAVSEHRLHRGTPGHWRQYLSRKEHEVLFEHLGLNKIISAFDYDAWDSVPPKEVDDDAPAFGATSQEAADVVFADDTNPSFKITTANVAAVSAAAAKAQSVLLGRWINDKGIFERGMPTNGNEMELGKVLLRAIMRGRLVIACAGTSNAAGHDNMFNQSFPVVLATQLGEWLRPFGVNVVIRNQAMAGHNPQALVLCLDTLLGSDVDVVLWEFAMMEGGLFKAKRRQEYDHELFVRQVFMLPRRPAVHFVTTGWGRPWATRNATDGKWYPLDHLDAQKEFHPKTIDPSWPHLRDYYQAHHMHMHRMNSQDAMQMVDHLPCCHSDTFCATGAYWHPSAKGHQLLADLLHFYYAKTIIMVMDEIKADLEHGSSVDDIRVHYGDLEEREAMPDPVDCEPEVCSVRPHCAFSELTHQGLSIEDALVIPNSVANQSMLDSLNHWKEERTKNIRPWSSFFAKSQFALPTFGGLVARVRGNLVWYISNYLVIFLCLCAYTMVSNPLFLFALVFVALLWYWSLKVAKDRRFLGDRVPFGQRERGILCAVITLVVFFFASAGMTLTWLVGVSVIVIGLHTVFHKSEAELNGSPFSSAKDLAEAFMGEEV